MGLTTAHDIALTLGQWLPYKAHYYGYYFVAISFFLVSTVYNSVGWYYEGKTRQTVFTEFKVAPVHRRTSSCTSASRRTTTWPWR